MRTKFKKTIFGALFTLAGMTVNAQGLENVIVEEYYTITQADADAHNNGFGGGSYPLVAGMKTYRIFVDMAPGYKLIQIYGTPIPPNGGTVSLNPLDITTTTTFWNDDNWGSELPNQTRRFPQGNAFDSYITVNTTGLPSTGLTCGSVAGQFGVLRSADTDGNLTMCTVYPGFSGNDGNIPGTGPALVYNLGGTMDFSAFTGNGSSFQVVNESWTTLPASQGVDPNGTNRALIAQVTTDGVLSFHLNVQVSDPNSNLETYVWNQASTGETVLPFLSFPVAACEPPAITSATSNGPICSTSELELNVVATGTGPLAYAWTGAGTITNGATANATVANAATGDYTIVVSNDCGTVDQTVAVIVNPTPNAAISYDDSPYCNTGSATVTLTGTSGGDYSSTAGLSINTTTGEIDLAATTPDTYTVAYNVPASGGCSQFQTTASVTIEEGQIWYADQDGDGFGDPGMSIVACSQPQGYVSNSTDTCPALSGNVGDTCDDGNANSSNDVITENCVCAGTLANDCLGVPGGSAQPGTPCDDQDATTENDVYNANCVCEGTPVGEADCEGVIGGPATIGSPCDDQDANTENDVYNANCVCEGTPIQEDDCLGVPGGTAQPGTSCDDNNAGTINDTWTANCQCVGTPIGDCTEIVTIELQTDANGAQTSWEILSQGSLTVICSGAGFPANSVVTENCCLPEGCYVLRVNDSAGDGMASGTNGGYILRTSPENERIIDNRNNFLSGSTSAIANDAGFCLPIGEDRLVFSHCDKLYWLENEFLVASLNPAVSAEWIDGAPNSQQDANSGYQFWFFDPNGSYSFIWFRRHSNSHGYGEGPARAAHLRINNWLGAYHIPENVLMNVRVRGVVEGVPMEWGPACRFMIDPVAAACPPTKLLDIPYSQFLSCGQYREFTFNSYVHAVPVSGASQYQFRFRQPAEGYEKIRTTSTYIAQLWWAVDPLVNGTVYEVDVRAFKNGQWCDWGEICVLNIGAPGDMGQRSSITTESVSNEVELNIWPNPNRGDQLFLSINALPANVATITTEVFDMYGKRVMNETIPVVDGAVNTNMALHGRLAAGMYMVNIQAGEYQTTERLVIQP